jgi:hypothetical protein
LWVISAGYGLISETAQLHGYSATFARGHPDSVAKAEDIVVDNMNEAWWEHLIRWPGPEHGMPRSLAELAQDDPRTGMLVMGSPDYLRAVEQDLLTAATRLDDDARLVVISSREIEKTCLGGYLIVSDSRLQSQLGGARTSLHARVGRQVISFAARCGWVVGKLREEYNRMLTIALEKSVNRRRRVTNEEVQQFICEELVTYPRARSTGLLRKLRDRGQACEQARFKALFDDVRKNCGAT